MSDLTLTDHATGLVMCAERVRTIADEVAGLVAAGNLDGASVVLGTQGGKMAELGEAWDDLHKRLIAAGADWKRARDGGLE